MFTPSAKLVANGGQCWALLVGGGGGGTSANMAGYAHGLGGNGGSGFVRIWWYE